MALERALRKVTSQPGCLDSMSLSLRLWKKGTLWIPDLYRLCKEYPISTGPGREKEELKEGKFCYSLDRGLLVIYHFNDER